MNMCGQSRDICTGLSSPGQESGKGKEKVGRSRGGGVTGQVEDGTMGGQGVEWQEMEWEFGLGLNSYVGSKPHIWLHLSPET